MKQVIFTVMMFCLAATATQAQAEYKNAIGLRLGYPISVSYKTFISEQGAIEVFGGFRGYSNYSWFNVAGLYQHHFTLAHITPGLQWYVGGGAGVYFWNFDFETDDSNTSFGILGCVGLDYKFQKAPISLTLDWVPSFFISGYGNGFGGGYGGLGVRYTF
ncbi:MAG: hypothetical protein KA974_03710 [Saprospiraceae bacterium]|nr:hypothetical protein [Saprospiraceae bacterium]MBP7699514.1 hypothetical protein [Saprospiraceae bacterium]